MEQQITNGSLYNETLQLYVNRHRKLTIGRLVKETGLPWNFVGNLPQRVPTKSDHKLQVLYDHLKRYENNPDLI